MSIFQRPAFTRQLIVFIERASLAPVHINLRMLVICPILIIIIHNVWHFTNLPKSILYLISLVISLLGLIMFIMIPFSMTNSYASFIDVSQHIGFIAGIFVYGLSCVLSLVFL